MCLAVVLLILFHVPLCSRFLSAGVAVDAAHTFFPLLWQFHSSLSVCLPRCAYVFRVHYCVCSASRFFRLCFVYAAEPPYDGVLFLPVHTIVAVIVCKKFRWQWILLSNTLLVHQINVQWFLHSKPYWRRNDLLQVIRAYATGDLQYCRWICFISFVHEESRTLQMSICVKWTATAHTPRNLKY